MKALAIVLAAALASPACCESSTPLLRSTEIAVTRIEHAEPGPWQMSEPGLRNRTVVLDLAIVKVAKGSLHPGSHIRISVTQSEPTDRIIAVPNVWSGKTLDPGTQQVLLASAPTLRCDEIARVDEDQRTWGDVLLALEFESQRWELDQLCRRIDPRRRKALGPVFAEYLGARLPEAVKGNARKWDRILCFVESPELSADFRALMSDAVFDALLTRSPAPESHTIRTTISAFRCLAATDANGLHNRIVKSQLPTLLGWEGPEPPRTAAAVFKDEVQTRVVAEKTLRALLPSPERDRLLNWLKH